MKVSVSLISLVSTILLIDKVLSERINCKVIPFETQDGLSGTCCVFFNKNTTISKFPKEEVTKQILSDRRNEGERNQSLPNQGKNTGDGKVVFMDDQSQNLQNKTSRPQVNVGNEKKLPPNVTIHNKNAFDTPEKCPEGKLRDHTGACTEPF